MSNINCSCITGCFQCCPYTEYVSNTNYSRIPRSIKYKQRKYPKQNKRTRGPFTPHQKRPDSRVPTGHETYCIVCDWTVVDGKCSVSCYDPNFTCNNFSYF